MVQKTSATLVFPRSGQRIRVTIPLDQYEAIVRRNQELIHHFSPENSLANRRQQQRHSEEIMKISSLAG